MAFRDDNDGIQGIFWKFRAAFNIGLKGHFLYKKAPKISKSSYPIAFQNSLEFLEFLRQKHNISKVIDKKYLIISFKEAKDGFL